MGSLMSVCGFSQTTYNITQNTPTSSLPFPNQCANCIINISAGVTLEVNTDIYLQNTTFNGGTIHINNKKLTYWSNGQFNGVTVNVNANGGIVTSSLVVLNNSLFIFRNNSTAIIYSAFQLISSKMKFLDNSSLEATSGNFELKSGSSLIAGDGSLASNGAVKFNGASLYQYDNSFITMANYNNYYFNWNSYRAVSNNIWYTTTNNVLNCGVGKNACFSPNLYGPATLSGTGIISAAMLPVKLSLFSVQRSGNTITVDWKTDQEMNAERFEIEWTADGKSWETAGTVAATGNSSIPVSYHFSENRNFSETLSYRLKTVDLDGSFAYSYVKTIKGTAATKINIYPNPAKRSFVLNYPIGTSKSIQVRLINYLWTHG